MSATVNIVYVERITIRSENKQISDKNLNMYLNRMCLLVVDNKLSRGLIIDVENNKVITNIANVEHRIIECSKEQEPYFIPFLKEISTFLENFAPKQVTRLQNYKLVEKFARYYLALNTTNNLEYTFEHVKLKFNKEYQIGLPIFRFSFENVFTGEEIYFNGLNKLIAEKLVSEGLCLHPYEEVDDLLLPMTRTNHTTVEGFTTNKDLFNKIFLAIMEIVVSNNIDSFE